MSFKEPEEIEIKKTLTSLNDALASDSVKLVLARCGDGGIHAVQGGVQQVGEEIYADTAWGRQRIDSDVRVITNRR
jgi:hypothetical protein